MGSRKLKPVVRQRRTTPAPARRRTTAAKKTTPVVPFGIVAAANSQSRADVAAAEVASLRTAVERQAVQLANAREALRQQMDALTAIATAPAAPSSDAGVLETTLREAHATLTRGVDIVGALIGSTTQAHSPVAGPRPEPSIDAFVRAKSRRVGYDDLKQRLAAAAKAHVPEGAVVMVVSRGDESLVGAGAWHFPQNDDGVYAGYHPAGSQQAVRHLEALRAKGGQFLLFPATASWWLDHYGEFRRHLERNYRLVCAEPELCAIYDVRTERTGEQR
jgi:hypothetical protein